MINGLENEVGRLSGAVGALLLAVALAGCGSDRPKEDYKPIDDGHNHKPGETHKPGDGHNH